jgi:uncharacterized membrane protein
VITRSYSGWSLVQRVWPLAAAISVTVFALLPVVAPLLLEMGQTGPAMAIYAFYRFTCHQWAHRSFFVLGSELSYSADDLVAVAGPDGPYGFLGSDALGYKMAFCERDFAIYATAALASIAFSAFRHRIAPLSARWYLLLLLPITLDGTSQLFGLRESTPFLRVLTGLCFGLGSVWFIFPRVDMIMTAMLESRHISRRTVGGIANVE